MSTIDRGNSSNAGENGPEIIRKFLEMTKNQGGEIVSFTNNWVTLQETFTIVIDDLTLKESAALENQQKCQESIENFGHTAAVLTTEIEALESRFLHSKEKFERGEAMNTTTQTTLFLLTKDLKAKKNRYRSIVEQIASAKTELEQTMEQIEIQQMVTDFSLRKLDYAMRDLKEKEKVLADVNRKKAKKERHCTVLKIQIRALEFSYRRSRQHLKRLRMKRNELKKVNEAHESQH